MTPCRFCPRCGTRRLSVKAGTLDDTSRLAPDAHYWTKRKQQWLPLPAGARCVEDDG